MVRSCHELTPFFILPVVLMGDGLRDISRLWDACMGERREHEHQALFAQHLARACVAPRR
jgi:hypothetical protein